jgi:ubiquitin carboxyl-terminal hydrolase L3
MSETEQPSSVTFQWPPLESNPEIFEEYMHQMGLPEPWGFSELFGFEEDLLAFVPQPVVAVIVNYERLVETKKEDSTTTTTTTPGSTMDTTTSVNYYMKQTETLDNACGVIACLHAIFNNMELIALEEGKTLSKYWENAQGKTPEERAILLEGFTEFQQQHKAFASQGQSNLAESQSDVKHHYVAFVVNAGGQLVELDGTKPGPQMVAENCQDLLRGSIAEVQKRLTNGEVSESLSMMVLSMK